MGSREAVNSQNDSEQTQHDIPHVFSATSGSQNVNFAPNSTTRGAPRAKTPEPNVTRFVR